MTHTCPCGSTDFLARADLFHVGRFLWWYYRRRVGSVVMCYNCEHVWLARRSGLMEPKWTAPHKASEGPPPRKPDDKPPKHPLEKEADLKW